MTENLDLDAPLPTLSYQNMPGDEIPACETPRINVVTPATGAVRRNNVNFRRKEESTMSLDDISEDDMFAFNNGYQKDLNAF